MFILEYLWQMSVMSIKSCTRTFLKHHKRLAWFQEWHAEEIARQLYIRSHLSVPISLKINSVLALSSSHSFKFITETVIKHYNAVVLTQTFFEICKPFRNTANMIIVANFFIAIQLYKKYNISNSVRLAAKRYSRK